MLLRNTFAFALAAITLTFGSTGHADERRSTTATIAMTDTQAIETIDTAKGVRLALPFGDHTEAVYQLAVEFSGDREKTVTLFEWVGTESGVGMWNRRSYFNSRFHGSPTGGTLSLTAGRTYLLVCHYKPGNPPPHNDLPWYQASATSRTTNGTASGNPSISAAFNDAADGSASASLSFVRPGGVARVLPAP